MREMVIDKMDPKTRCRFAQCSKLCEKEAKESQNYLRSLGIDRVYPDILRLTLNHGDDWDGEYCLEFRNAGKGQTRVVYKNEDECWRKYRKYEKMEYGEPNFVRTKYIKEYLEKYKNSIRKFYLKDDYEELGDINIDNLRKLTYISFSGGYRCVSELENGFIDKLLRIEKISVSNVQFTFDQIVNFQGKKADFESNEFEKNDINKYLKMWKNGEIHENVENVRIWVTNYDDGSIPKKSITEGLDVYDYVERYVIEPDEESDDDDELSIQYQFYCKCATRGNKWFFVKYRPFCVLEVQWKQPESE